MPLGALPAELRPRLPDGTRGSDTCPDFLLVHRILPPLLPHTGKTISVGNRSGCSTIQGRHSGRPSNSTGSTLQPVNLLQSISLKPGSKILHLFRLLLQRCP